MKPGHTCFRRSPSLALLVAWLCFAPVASAQIDTITLEVPPTAVGLDGTVRQGTWTPMRLTLQNHAAEPREVICRWATPDFDGDTVHHERRVTLSPHRTQHVWLYAAPAANHFPNRNPWLVQVLDADTRRLLAHQTVAPRRQLDSHQSLIAVMSSASLGFAPYAERYTQHEAIDTLRGLTLHDLPDRWFGLSTLQAIIWTREGSEPDNSRFTLAHQQALREWVRRGGQLVIILPTVGQTWTGSPLADLMPVESRHLRTVQRPLPPWVGSPRTEQLHPVEYTTFDTTDLTGVEVLRRDREGDATIVARRFGLGRVTVVGVNLADRRLTQMGVPNGRFRVWHDIFHWQFPVYEADVAEQQIREGNLARPTMRDTVELGRFLPPAIAMRNTAGPVLLMAVFVFGAYWLLAGPIGFVVLRQKNAMRHSWLAFVAVVVAFTIIAWGGAIVVQPRQASVAHFSVVDFDATTNQARTRSWLSLFVPEFGRANVQLGPTDANTSTAPASPASASQNTLASPGWNLTGIDNAGFLDPQTYTLPAADPNQTTLPVRATAKQLELDYRGQLGDNTAGLREPWIMPQGKLRIEQFWPAGQLQHGLPGDLRDVLIIYCPGAAGENQQRWMPWVWRHGDWPRDEILDLVPPSNADRLVSRQHRFDAERNWAGEGYLGQLIARRTGQRFADMDPLQAVSESEIIQAVEMLSFYSALPAPNFRATGLSGVTRRPVGYQRDLGRSLDISHLITGRRLIIIGHLENSSLPAPLTLDNQPLNATGWTVVRWIYDFE